MKIKTRRPDSGLDDFNRKKTFRLMIIALAVIIFVLSAVTVWNATNLQQAINKRTMIYVSDVSIQLSDDINFRLTKNVKDLEVLADSLLQLDELQDTETLKHFLDRKTLPLGFTAIAILNRDGRVYSTKPIEGDLFNQLGVQASFQGENGVSLLNQQSILYSIPLKENNETIAVLAGLRDKENMQNLIQPKSFSGLGLTCIVDINGNVVISPKDLNSFMQLDSIFSKQTNSHVVAEIEKMQENMKNHQPGIFSFTAVNGSELVLSYEPIPTYDWVLLTLVPANIISYETDGYIMQSFLIIAGIILLFVVILVILIKIYRKYFRHLEQIAFTDRITGGDNNNFFQLKCEKLLQAAPPNTYCIVLFNIKNFKLINENFGSYEGNNTLRHVMTVINRHVTKDEPAARSEADNFFLCLKEHDEETIKHRLEEIVTDINSFNQALEEPYYLTIQRGAYIVSNPFLEITVIQDRAKTACRNRQAYEDGKCIFYDEAYTKKLQKEHELNDILDHSLANGDFQVYLQPKVWLNSGEVGGAEALVRWIHPQRGTIFPSDFIPLFEKNGNICKLDLYVFKEVCKTLRRWIDEGLTPIPVSVNLSRHHFKASHSLKPFADVSRKYHIPKNLIELELTESIFFDDQAIKQVKQSIHEMHQMGFLCSLDDFGAGFSSLGLLMEFDVDVIKLDRRFFSNVAQPKTRDVVESITSLAKKIGVKTVAEGIEEPRQLDFLRQVQCDMGQGYIYSKPVCFPEFELWWKNL